MIKPIFICLFVMLAAMMVSGEANSQDPSVRILYKSDNVLSETPVFALIEVRNDSPQEIIIPAGQTWPGTIIEAYKNGSFIPPTRFTGAMWKVRILKPGESYLVFQQIPQIRDKGLYEIHAILESNGECPVMTKFAAENGLALHKQTGNGGLSDCWSGRVMDTTSINVAAPSSKEDEKTLHLVKNTGVANPSDMASRFATSYQELQLRYPGSYYTMVAGFAASGSSDKRILAELVSSQPGHVLTPVARLYLSLSQPTAEGNETAAMLPEPLRKYYDQLKADETTALDTSKVTAEKH